MAENNSSAPLKTAEGAVHPHLIALRTIAEYPATDSLMNMDAANMRRIAAQAVLAQAAPADGDGAMRDVHPHLIVPGMAVHALGSEIIDALLKDEKDGGYDLTAGLFGPAFSTLVRRWAKAEWNVLHLAPLKTAEGLEPSSISAEQVEAATMALLQYDSDPAPGVNWESNRRWKINDVRRLMRNALKAAKAPQRVDAQEPVAWPKDASEVRAFFRSDFLNMEFGNADESPSDNDKYLISTHDFLSAVNWWADYPHVPRDVEPAAQPQAEVQAEPVAWLIQRSAFHVSPHGQDAEGYEWLEVADEPGMEGSFPVYTAPQTQPADALDAQRWRDHIGKLDALVTYCPTCCQGFTAKPEMTRDEVIFECGKTAGRSVATAKEGK